MPDMEKVKKGLQAHAEGCGYRSNYCDFMECPYRIGDESCDIEQMCIDALALLKEQEPKTATDIQLSRDGFVFGGCPKCKALITHADHKKYCGYCGQAVKWDA